ncbi:MAG TPA: hypothetical protein PK798_14765 [Flavobacteriales bacterium]|nr:hypothetical protein [Flavobacteriales bacterium]
MRKVIFSVAAVALMVMSLSSCGLFRAGKHEKCPAYSSVSTVQNSDLTELPENGNR